MYCILYKNLNKSFLKTTIRILEWSYLLAHAHKITELKYFRKFIKIIRREYGATKCIFRNFELFMFVDFIEILDHAGIYGHPIKLFPTFL